MESKNKKDPKKEDLGRNIFIICLLWRRWWLWDSEQPLAGFMPVSQLCVTGIHFDVYAAYIQAGEGLEFELNWPHNPAVVMMKPSSCLTAVSSVLSFALVE